jgi:hypothetical protein
LLRIKKEKFLLSNLEMVYHVVEVEIVYLKHWLLLRERLLNDIFLSFLNQRCRLNEKMSVWLLHCNPERQDYRSLLGIVELVLVIDFEILGNLELDFETPKSLLVLRV